MAHAVSLIGGKLGEITVPELAVFTKIGAVRTTVKPASTVVKIGNNAVIKVDGWYYVQGKIAQYVQGDSIPIVKDLSILGPFQ